MASLMKTLKLVQKLTATNPAFMQQAARNSKFMVNKIFIDFSVYVTKFMLFSFISGDSGRVE